MVAQPPARGVRRQMERLQLKPSVTVVQLRKKKRPENPHRSATGRHLTHRHIVRGHWKRRPHDPGCNGCKCQYIAPYVAGPEGAPWYVSDKVNALIR